MRSLWLVEDDELVAADLLRLEREVGLKVRVIGTEEDFRAGYQDLATSNPPAAIVLDVMLKWTRPSLRPTLPPPEYKNYQKAGLRCRELLRSFPLTATTPVIFYTGLEASDVSEMVKNDALFTKRAGHRNLIAYVRQLLIPRDSPLT